MAEQWNLFLTHIYLVDDLVPPNITYLLEYEIVPNKLHYLMSVINLHSYFDLCSLLLICK